MTDAYSQTTRLEAIALVTAALAEDRPLCIELLNAGKVDARHLALCLAQLAASFLPLVAELHDRGTDDYWQDVARRVARRGLSPGPS